MANSVACPSTEGQSSFQLALRGAVWCLIQVKRLQLPLREDAVLEWLGARDGAASLADIAAGLGLGPGDDAQLLATIRSLQEAAEVYETGISTGLFRLL